MHMDQKSKQELRSWIFPILMLIFVTPLGVLLIVLKKKKAKKDAQ